MDLAGYDGLADIYIQDLATNKELHFIYQLGQLLSTNPDVSFTAASLIKIPILVSIYARTENGLSEHSQNLVDEMMIESYNEPADQLMEENIDSIRAPLIFTEEMQSLGLENTLIIVDASNLSIITNRYFIFYILFLQSNLLLDTRKVVPRVLLRLTEHLLDKTLNLSSNKFSSSLCYSYIVSYCLITRTYHPSFLLPGSKYLCAHILAILFVGKVAAKRPAW